MSYSTANGPALIVGGLGGGAQSTVGASTAATGYVTASGGFNVWDYRSSDPVSMVVGSSYITDGWNRGMKLGDPVLVIDTGSTTAPINTWAQVAAVSTAPTSGLGGVTLTRMTSGA